MRRKLLLPLWTLTLLLASLAILHDVATDSAVNVNPVAGGIRSGGEATMDSRQWSSPVSVPRDSLHVRARRRLMPSMSDPLEIQR